MRPPRSTHAHTTPSAASCSAYPAASVLLQSTKTLGVVLLACAASACGADGGDGWNEPHLTTGASSSNEPASSSSAPQTGTLPAESDTPPTSGTAPSEQSSTTMAPIAPQVPPADGTGEEPTPSSGGEPPIPSSDTSTEMQPPSMPPAVTPPIDMPPGVSPEPDAGTFPTGPGPGTSTQDADAGVEPGPDIDAPGAMSGEEVPMTDHCAAVADWDPMWTQWEDEVLLLVNEYRAMGYNCDSQGSFDATTPVATDPMLRCAARLHSLDMYERGYFDHDNPDGVDPFERMAAAGFSGSYMGENIAQGQSSPEDVMRAWMESDGHCSNVMNPNYTLIGVGFHPGSDSDRRAQRYWTQNFGAPPRQGGGGRR